MPSRCAVTGCGNQSKRDHIKLFSIPFQNSEGAVQKARREKWISFIRQGRLRPWNPTKSTTICSKHFTPDSFQNRYDKKLLLEEDEIGICATPTLREESVTAKIVQSPPAVVNNVVPKFRRERVNAISNRLLEKAVKESKTPLVTEVSIIVKDFQVETRSSSTQTDEAMPALAERINSILERVLNQPTEEPEIDAVGEANKGKFYINSKQQQTSFKDTCTCKCKCNNKENCLSKKDSNAITFTGALKEPIPSNTVIRDSCNIMSDTLSLDTNNRDFKTTHENAYNSNSKTLTEDNMVISLSSKTLVKKEACGSLGDVNCSGTAASPKVEMKDGFMQTLYKECTSCRELRTRNRVLSNRIIDWKSKHSENSKMIKTLQMEIDELKNQLSQQVPTTKNKKGSNRRRPKNVTKTTGATSTGRKTQCSEAQTTSSRVYCPSAKKQKTDSSTITEINGVRVIVR